MSTRVYGEEFLHVVEGRPEVARVERESVGAFHHAQFGSLDVLGDVLAVLRSVVAGIASCYDEGGYVDEGQCRPGVNSVEPARRCS